MQLFGLAVGGLLTSIALGQTVTVTRRPATCSALFTSGSHTVTMVRSTVTVSPSPLPSQGFNNGPHFLLELVSPVGDLQSRQAHAPVYITLNGSITGNAQLAGKYYIHNSMLYAINGYQISAAANALNETFAVTSLPGPIATSFMIQDSLLRWGNSAFKDGAAQFFLTNNTIGSRAVIAYFNGMLAQGWLPIALSARSVGSGSTASSNSLFSSTTISSFIIGSMTLSPSGTVTLPSGTSSISNSTTPSGFPSSPTSQSSVARSPSSLKTSVTNTVTTTTLTSTPNQTLTSTLSRVSSPITIKSSASSGKISSTSLQSSTNFKSSSSSDTISTASSASFSSSQPSASTTSTSSSSGTSSHVPTSTISSSTSFMSLTTSSTTRLPSTSLNTSSVSSTMYSSGSTSTTSLSLTSSSASSSHSSSSAAASSSSATLHTSSTSSLSPGLTTTSSSISSSTSTASTSTSTPSSLSRTTTTSSSSSSSSTSSGSSSTSSRSLTSSTLTSSSSTTLTPSSLTSSTSTLSTPSSSSSTSVSSTSSTTQYLVLASPTPCSFGDPPATDEDDSYCEIDLPSPMTLYSSSATQTFASSNGFISLLNGSTQYQAQPLPDSNLPADTIAPFFDDLFIYGNATQTQGIFYQANSTGVTYEYYLSRAGQQQQIVHFTVEYAFAQPGIFTYRYLQVGNGNNGQMAAVGMQGETSAGVEKGYTYSFKAAKITPGLVLVCNASLNSCTSTA